MATGVLITLDVEFYTHYKRTKSQSVINLIGPPLKIFSLLFYPTYWHRTKKTDKLRCTAFVCLFWYLSKLNFQCLLLGKNYSLPQHFLYFLPLPHGHNSFLPTLLLTAVLATLNSLVMSILISCDRIFSHSCKL